MFRMYIHFTKVHLLSSNTRIFPAWCQCSNRWVCARHQVQSNAYTHSLICIWIAGVFAWFARRIHASENTKPTPLSLTLAHFAISKNIHDKLHEHGHITTSFICLILSLRVPCGCFDSIFFSNSTQHRDNELQTTVYYLFSHPVLFFLSLESQHSILCCVS